MTKPSKSIIQRLDAAANLTGIPQLTMNPPRRRAMKWWPLAIIAVATIGFGITLFLPSIGYIGALLFVPGLAGGTVALRGPLKPWGTEEFVDERERLERSRAYLRALAIILALVWIALLGLVYALWLTTVPREMLAHLTLYFGQYLLTLFTTLPTLFASWRMKPLEEGE